VIDSALIREMFCNAELRRLTVPLNYLGAPTYMAEQSLPMVCRRGVLSKKNSMSTDSL
jgi:hypothetical protein